MDRRVFGSPKNLFCSLHKETMFKNEDLLLDIGTFTKDINNGMKAMNYSNVTLMNDFNYIKLNYLDRSSIAEGAFKD